MNFEALNALGHSSCFTRSAAVYCRVGREGRVVAGGLRARIGRGAWGWWATIGNISRIRGDVYAGYDARQEG